MSWLSDTLHGDFNWVGGKNTLEQLGIVSGLALGGVGLGALAGEGAFAGLGAAGAGAAEAGGAAAAGAPLDLLSFGSAAGTAVPAAEGAILPATGALASGLATEPAFAGSALGAFAPGLDTTAAGLGGLSAASGALDSFAAAPGATAMTGPGVSATGPTGFDSLAIGGTPGGGVGAAPAAPGGAAVSAPAGVNAPLDLTAQGGKAAGGGGFLDKLGQGAVNSITKNPIGTALGVGGLGLAISQGQKPLQGQDQLNQIANQNATTGAQLEKYLTSGTLPPGLQASVSQATNAAKARAISNMASQGMSTDPRHNTALASELAQIDVQIPILTAQIGQQLLSSGLTASGLASNVYTTLANIDQTQTAAIGKAIANMAAALAGGTRVPGTNLQVSQAAA